MQIFRLFTALTVVFSGVLIGLYLSQRLTKRRETLGEFEKLFSKVRLKISYTGADLSTVFSDNFRGFTFESDTPFEAQWRRFINETDGLSDDDRALLIGFLDGLGSSDAESQTEHISLYSRLIGDHIKSAEREIENKAKVCRTLPAAAGLILAIFII